MKYGIRFLFLLPSSFQTGPFCVGLGCVHLNIHTLSIFISQRFLFASFLDLVLRVLSMFKSMSVLSYDFPV